MDWSVIATLKWYYIRRVKSQDTRATGREGGLTPEEILERV